MTEWKTTWSTAESRCLNYGQEWRMPLSNELVTIYSNKLTVNSILLENGYNTLKDDYYWADSDKSSYTASRLNFANGYSDYGTWGVSTYYYARAILSF